MSKESNDPTWTVWREGYRATGAEEKAHLAGTLVAKSFFEACEKLFENNANYDSERNTLWGCKLFDNEIDARRFFG